MPLTYSYSPQDLAEAVATSRSWRGVLRALGHPGTSAGAFRAVRRQVDELGLDHSHFTGQRRWSDRDLGAAVDDSATWFDVLTALGLSHGGGNLASVRAAAVRLGLDVTHLANNVARVDRPLAATAPRIEFLRTAAPHLAAAWFELRGYEVLWPPEGCRYDLVVREANAFSRVQVKTTTYRQHGRLTVRIAGTRHDKHFPYDINEVEFFFILDDRLDAYLIPYEVVAGRRTLCLARYTHYLVAEGGRWLDATPAAATSCASPGP